MRSFVLTVFAALFVAGLVVAGYKLYSENAGQEEALTQQPADQVDPAAEKALTQQAAQPVENAGPVGTSVIPTDDPFYLGCMEKPLAEGETLQQRTSYCNQELQKQIQNQPSGNQ